MKALTLTMMLLCSCSAYSDNCYLPVSGHVVYPDNYDAGQQRIMVGVGSWKPQQTPNDVDAGVEEPEDTL